VILSENRYPLFGITRRALGGLRQNSDFAAVVAALRIGAG
jgi:hypothetical protein